MKSKRKSGHEYDVRLGTAGSSASEIRRVRRDLLELDKNRRRGNRSIERELRSLGARYRRSLSELIGSTGMRQLRELRKQRSTMSRSQRIRRINALLEEVGIDRVQLLPLHRAYENDARALLSRGDERLLKRPRLPGPCESPWVTYTAPYSGYFWSFNWERSSNPDNPTLTRYLDLTTGRTGSSIQTHLSGADDDDRLTADYYTGLNVWHTALATGQLEVYLAFEFTTSTYSGKVKDEFGFSNATWHQWGGARFLALESQAKFETQESRILHVIDTDWGDGASWTNYAEKPRDLHWYYFRTAAEFDQGTSLLLEAGINTLSWFHANDESVTTAEDVDLRLDRIMVRSCPADPIL
ncbi:MAG: hypothetical protein M3O61_12495 [Gemmatimonadota bacterium]|nr:hypothetical protein [Gemmatimonadota bacterium]